MILKFLKKGFEIYVMGTDGDPDMDPLQLVMNFIKAMAVAIGFRPIYDIFVRILKETVNTITTSMNIYKEVTDFTGIGIINGVFFLIALVIFMILFCKAFGLGINMMILNIGMPLACTGLLDNDKGMFKNYFMTYVKTFLTVLVQVVLSKLGLYVIVTSAGIHLFQDTLKLPIIRDDLTRNFFVKRDDKVNKLSVVIKIPYEYHNQYADAIYEVNNVVSQDGCCMLFVNNMIYSFASYLVIEDDYQNYEKIKAVIEKHQLEIDMTQTLDSLYSQLYSRAYNTINFTSNCSKDQILLQMAAVYAYKDKDELSIVDFVKKK